MKTKLNTLAAMVLATAGLLGCATADAVKDANQAAVAATQTAPFAKPGFFTQEHDGRLWVFVEGSDDHKAFLEKGPPVRQVRRISAGPGGMTVISTEAEHLDAYLAK